MQLLKRILASTFAIALLLPVAAKGDHTPPPDVNMQLGPIACGPAKAMHDTLESHYKDLKVVIIGRNDQVGFVVMVYKFVMGNEKIFFVVRKHKDGTMCVLTEGVAPKYNEIKFNGKL